MRAVLWIGLFGCMGAAFAQQPAVSELTLRTDPADARVRPLGTIVIQVMTYGDVDAGDAVERVRLQAGDAELRLPDGDSGRLSKPFRYQGEESEPFYEPPNQGFGSILLGRARGQFLLQDAVLYSAPQQPGSYTIEASLGGLSAKAEITVAEDAPPSLPIETTVFCDEADSTDPYRGLVEHYAPFIAQETWFQPKTDYLARFDLDGDWRGDNNWENAEVGSSQAYVYYAAMESGSHWFLIYNMFHPRDYSDKCIAGSCHENDNEGMILTVRKDGSQFGRLEAMETLAHNNVYTYVANRRIRRGAHDVDGPIELHDESHPAVFIESGGHGVYGSADPHSRYRMDGGDFIGGTGVTYVFKRRAERPAHSDDREVGYELLPIWDYWWLRAHEGPGRLDRTFDDYYRYLPAGGRPRTPYDEIAGSFLGRTQSENNAKPFWGWHDNRTRKKGVLATGQWGLDPAYAVAKNLRFPEPVSDQYIFNPYLGIGTAARQQASSTTTNVELETETESPSEPVRSPDPSERRSMLRIHLDALVVD